MADSYFVVGIETKGSMLSMILDEIEKHCVTAGRCNPPLNQCIGECQQRVEVVWKPS